MELGKTYRTGPVAPLPFKAITELPERYTVEQDEDGDWVLNGPPDVVLFSVPGEGVLLDGETREAAIADALAYLRDCSAS